jgi:hypothetical protein
MYQVHSTHVPLCTFLTHKKGAKMAMIAARGVQPCYLDSTEQLKRTFSVYMYLESVLCAEPSVSSTQYDCAYRATFYPSDMTPQLTIGGSTKK